jgi:hypothetical protein
LFSSQNALYVQLNVFNLENGQSISRSGRPTKYSGGIVEQLCAALADGLSIKSACAVSGIGVTTLAEWRELYPELEERMSEARELARQKALQAIKCAGEKDWRAWAEWLRLAYAADYRGNANKIEVSATANASSGLTIPQERLHELQERRKAALERFKVPRERNEGSNNS